MRAFSETVIEVNVKVKINLFVDKIRQIIVIIGNRTEFLVRLAKKKKKKLA